MLCLIFESFFERVWDYEEGALVNTFENHIAADKGVSRMCLLNELDDSMLLVASSTIARFTLKFSWLLYVSSSDYHLIL